MEPACINHNMIEEIIVLVPPEQPIADEQLLSVVLSSYSQVNPELNRRMEETGQWMKIKVGYGESPPNPENGMRGFAYAQSKPLQEIGKTILIQGGLDISEEGRRLGLPSEIWILTITRTPSGERPNIGFVINGALTPKND